MKIGAVTPLARPPSEYFLQNFVITTSGVCSQPALKLSLEVLGVDRILFAADYPYESVEEAVSFMDHADLSEDARAHLSSDLSDGSFGNARHQIRSSFLQ